MSRYCPQVQKTWLAPGIPMAGSSVSSCQWEVALRGSDRSIQDLSPFFFATCSANELEPVIKWCW